MVGGDGIAGGRLLLVETRASALTAGGDEGECVGKKRKKLLFRNVALNLPADLLDVQIQYLDQSATLDQKAENMQETQHHAPNMENTRP